MNCRLFWVSLIRPRSNTAREFWLAESGANPDEVSVPPLLVDGQLIRGVGSGGIRRQIQECVVPVEIDIPARTAEDFRLEMVQVIVGGIHSQAKLVIASNLGEVVGGRERPVVAGDRFP